MICFTNAGGRHSIHWGCEPNKKMEEGQLCCLGWGIRYPAFGHQCSYFLGLWTQAELYHWLLWFFTLKTAPVGLLGLHNYKPILAFPFCLSYLPINPVSLLVFFWRTWIYLLFCFFLWKLFHLLFPQRISVIPLKDQSFTSAEPWT